MFWSKGFEPKKAFVDPHKSFGALQGAFPGVEIDVSGARDRLDKVNTKIRRVKEVMRSVVTGLPYHLPKDRIKDSVTYAISRTNLKSTSALNTNEYLRERFTGMKPDYKSELGLSFGDYIEAYNPKAEEKFNDVFTPRTEPCIALCLMANQNGLWMMYNFSSCTSILRSQWKKVPISQAVIEMLNDLARVTGVQPTKIIPDANTRNDEIMEDVQHEPIQVQFYLNH
jgi:predicted ribosome quality control (RQC) complex YloA/Tae2 family protein